MKITNIRTQAKWAGTSDPSAQRDLVVETTSPTMGPRTYTVETISADSQQGKNRLEWADALESGDYAQTSGILARFRPTGDKFCCLGVVCDLGFFGGTWLRPKAEKGKPEPSTFTWNFKVKGDSDLYDNMPPNQEFATAFGCHPGVFAWMNDDGASFKQIAKVIRASVIS